MIPVSVILSVCKSITCTRCAKLAERIEVVFGVETLGDTRNIVHGSLGFDAAFAKLLWLLVANDDKCAFTQCWCTSAKQWRQAVASVVHLSQRMGVDGVPAPGLVRSSHNVASQMMTVHSGCIGNKLVSIHLLVLYV